MNSSRFFEPVEFRDDVGHRQATWLELFFDLGFVISIAALTAMLAQDATSENLVLYMGLFLAVYWIWNQFTWYGAHFDNNDVFFRLLYLAAILFVLVLAASVEGIGQGDTGLFVTSYVLLQSLLVTGWFRIYVTKPEYRSFSLKMLSGPLLGSLVWLISIRYPIPQQYYFWAAAMAIHIAAPYIAWRTKKFDIPLHQPHIVERYGLLTIIVLGETLVAVAAGLVSVPGSETFLAAILGYIIIGCIWWTYFNWDFENIREFENVSKVFVFGYGHFVVFLAIAAFGAGVEVAIHAAAHGGHMTLLERLLIALPPPFYLVALSLMNRFSWNMPFDKKMNARVGVALVSSLLAFAIGDASPVVFTAAIALLMVCLVCYEQIFCTTPQT